MTGVRINMIEKCPIHNKSLNTLYFKLLREEFGKNQKLIKSDRKECFDCFRKD